jgi:hypothetical protein
MCRVFVNSAAIGHDARLAEVPAAASELARETEAIAADHDGWRWIIEWKRSRIAEIGSPLGHPPDELQEKVNQRAFILRA